MTGNQMLRRFDMEFEEGKEYRLEIPAAVYTTVRSREQLERIIDSIEFNTPQLSVDDDGESDTVLYLGWDELGIGIADILAIDDN